MNAPSARLIRWFASSTITAHLLRGGLAIGLLAFAIRQQAAHPAGSFAAGVLALLLMRGCPACWTIGLLQAIGRAWTGRRGH